jgi:hypothetical protein
MKAWSHLYDVFALEEPAIQIEFGPRQVSFQDMRVHSLSLEQRLVALDREIQDVLQYNSDNRIDH